jgi:hypothetical protein
MQEYYYLVIVKNSSTRWQKYTILTGNYALVGIAVSTFADRKVHSMFIQRNHEFRIPSRDIMYNNEPTERLSVKTITIGAK